MQRKDPGGGGWKMTLVSSFIESQNVSGWKGP